MENHRKGHSNEFKVKCDIYDRGFYIKSDVQELKNIHTGAHPFKCNMYSKSFPYCNNLIAHKKTYMQGGNYWGIHASLKSMAKYLHIELPYPCT
jgi:hypothetical protein